MTVNDLQSNDRSDAVEARTGWQTVADSVRSTLHQVAAPECWATSGEGMALTQNSSAKTIAAAHVIEAVIPASRSERRHILSQLWRSVDAGACFAVSFNHRRSLISYSTIAADLLEVSLGRVLTEQLVVHPDPRGGLSEWATAIWTRLGPSVNGPAAK